MKKIAVFWLMFLCCASLVKAQDTFEEIEVDPDNPGRAILQYQRVGKRMADRIKKLEDDQEKLKAQLEEEKKNAKGKEARELKKLLALKEDTIRQLREGLQAAVDAELKPLQRKLEDLQKRYSRDSADLARLKPIQKIWIENTISSVDADWLSKPYSQIDAAELEKLYQQCSEYASTDKKIADARDKLKKLLDEVALYKKADLAAHSQYDAATVNTLKESIKALRSKVSDAAKKQELTTLYKQLNDYAITLEFFQKVIAAVDQQVAGQTHAGGFPLANATLNKLEADEGYITAIKNIPWLAEQYDAYYKQLQRDCVGPNRVRDLIMSLKP
jgi:chromosome segregation ATPase